MNIYEISYTKFISPWGDCDTTKYVRATSEDDALRIAKNLIKDNKSDIIIISELKTIN